MNGLVDAVRKADNTSDKTTKARMVNQIKRVVQALNRAFPKNKIVFNEKRMRIETESGNKVNKRNTVKNSTVAKEFSRDQYSDKTNEVIDAILGDENIANGFYIRGVDGMMLSVKQLSDAINGIRNGKVTEGGKALFDFIEESVNTGEVEIRDRATGVSDRVSLDEYMAAMKEVDAMYAEGTMPMTEWQVRNWLNEEAANNYEEETFDNVDNLPQYEQDITGFREGAEQQPSIERATGESAAGQEGAGVTEVTPGTDRNAPSQQEVEAKRREYESAQRKLSEAEDKLAKEQGQQADMFGDRGVQQGMFAPADAKEILDPLRQKVKEAKAAYEQAQKEFENEQLRQQPELGLKESAKELADKIRSFKIKNDKAFDATLGLPVTVWNGAMEIIATAVQQGGNIADALKRGLNYIQKNHRGQWNKKQFNDTVVAELGLRGIEVNGVDEFMSKEQKPEYAEVVNGFYSPIEQGLLDIKETELPANEWIKKLQGFTEQDELKYTGIEEWLKSQGKNKVQKSDIQQWINDNRIEIREIVKSDDPLSKVFYTAKETEDGSGWEVYYDGQYVDVFLKDDGFASADDAINEAIDAADPDYIEDFGTPKAAKYSQYQLPGDKSDYKEVLVTLPTKLSKESGKAATTETVYI